jgi:vanillate O-demethylase monooxygenase subunit
VFVPGQDLERAPGAEVYAVEERWGGVFIWMGDVAAADPALLPDAHLLTEPGWGAIRGMLPCAADYQLAVDNLLDLSHEAYLHPRTIGTEEVAEHPAKIRITEGKAVVERVMEDVPAPPLFTIARGITTNIDRRQTVTATLPSFVTVDVKATEVGRPDDPDALEWLVLFFMTPEREGRTHYFFAVTRNFAIDSDEVDDILTKGSLQTLAEDIDMLEAQQAMLQDRKLDSRTLFTRYDNAPDRVRLMVKRMIEREHAQQAAE